MANVKVTWVLPTTRKSGRPVAIEAIKHFEVAISVDGQNFAVFGTFPTDVLETVIPELEPGTWTVRGRGVDTDDQPGAALARSITIADTSPLSEPVALTLTLEE